MESVVWNEELTHPPPRTLIETTKRIDKLANRAGGAVMDRRVAFQPIRTISDHPLLVGEILRRSALRNIRRAKWRALWKKIRILGARIGVSQ